MTHKTAMVNARIDPKLKARAEMILNKVGLSSAEAIRLLYTQICLSKGLPFKVKIPNKTTQQALHDANTGNTHQAKDVASFFEDLNDEC